MKYLLLSFVIAGILLYGCVSVELFERDEAEKIASQQEREVRAPEEKDEFLEEEGREIIEAIEYALSLEALIWDKRAQIRERKDVVKILRKGFCDKKAEEITDYVWIEAVDRNGKKIHMLNPGEPLFTLPDSIEIMSEDRMNSLALLRYDENLQGPVTWTGHTIIATLMREDGIWKICETRVEGQEE